MNKSFFLLLISFTSLYADHSQVLSTMLRHSAEATRADIGFFNTTRAEKYVACFRRGAALLYSCPVTVNLAGVNCEQLPFNCGRIHVMDVGGGSGFSTILRRQLPTGNYPVDASSVRPLEEAIQLNERNEARKRELTTQLENLRKVLFIEGRMSSGGVSRETQFMEDDEVFNRVLGIFRQSAESR